jgi:imidazolonepropionase-like amidohydrolase
MTKNIKRILWVFTLLPGLVIGQKGHARFALLNGTAHIGDGKVIENALIIINKDKIESVSAASDFNKQNGTYDTIMDLSGKHVYPGLINPNNILGLHDAEAVRATRDFMEVGNVNPHIRALIAYNTDNLIIPTIKSNGILYTQVTPRAGLISGYSSVMALEGWNWEDAVLRTDDGIHLNFPKNLRRKRNEADEKESKENEKQYLQEINFLSKFFRDARTYCNSVNVSEVNLRFEALRSVFNGNANLYIHVDKVKDILSAISFIQDQQILKPVIVGGKESYKVTSDIRRYNIPVILNRVHDLPDNPDDDVDIVYKTPYLLQKDSILFCLQMEGDMEAMISRNLPFNAGSAVAYGLSKEQALAAVTANAAKILGIDKKVGLLKAGLLASLVISDGDILDMKTNNISLAYISGKAVDLNNRQVELYKKYKDKYGIK